MRNHHLQDNKAGWRAAPVRGVPLVFRHDGTIYALKGTALGKGYPGSLRNHRPLKVDLTPLIDSARQRPPCKDLTGGWRSTIHGGFRQKLRRQMPSLTQLPQVASDLSGFLGGTMALGEVSLHKIVGVTLL